MTGRLERSHLLLIRTLHEEGSLTAAANALCLTQSALSHSVRKLEDHLGTPLWQREGRRLRLTQAGRYLLRVAERLLPQFEHAEQQLSGFAEGLRGSLRIGMECHPCYEWLLPVISPYLEAWPDVDVDVRQRFRFGGMAALLQHDIDVLVTPDPLVHAGLVFEPVFDFELVLAVSQRHPLANVASIVPGHLADQTLLTYPVETDRLDVFTQFLLPAGVRPRHHRTVEATEILLQLVAAGRGVAVLPRWMIQAHRQAFKLGAVRLGASGIAKQICLGLRREDLDIEYLRGFVDMARHSAGVPVAVTPTAP